MSPRAATLAAVRRVVARLDFAALGRLYCDHGGEAFWRDRRGPLVALGMAWADAALRRLPAGGTSLYVGAGVAELPVLIAERLELGRRVAAVSQRAAECSLLDAALADAGLDLRWTLADASEAARGQAYDHLGCVSVLSDPETFPLLSAVTYGRVHPAEITAGAFAAEQERARALVSVVMNGVTRPGLVTTTVEEVPWFLAWAHAAGIEVAADDEMVDTAVVGDPIGFLRVG
jgi:hypothetical protein